MENFSSSSHSEDPTDLNASKQDPDPNPPVDELDFACASAATASREEPIHYEEESLDEDGQLGSQDCGYNSSASSTQHSENDRADKEFDEDDLASLNSRASSRSSISSIPDSVLIHPASELKAGIGAAADEHLRPPWIDHDRVGLGRMEGQLHLKSIHTIRQREAAFRKPSSVRAMQMYTEDEDDEFLTPPKRRVGHRMSDISLRSAGSSPLKKSPYYSPTGSAGRQKPKKEYPLVLLHCNLLPPSLPVPGLIGYPDQKVLREVLPLEYWRRWKLLEEKVGSGVLRDRGVLISHPEDMYDLLEERLLESLELQRPRLHHGHFLGHDSDSDSEKEDQSATEDSATDEEQGEECADCGGRFVRHETRRKWEIKVFAANGLMRAGAWAAAWREMEKVDVEVGLWLPSEIRRELEKRLLDHDFLRSGSRLDVPQLKEPTTDAITDMMNHPSHVDTPALRIDEATLFVPETASRPSSPIPELAAPANNTRPNIPVYHPRSVEEIDIQTLLINYIRVLASDRRNVAIGLLSILVAYLAVAIGSQPSTSNLRPFPQDMFEVVSIVSSAQPLMQSSSTAWAEQLRLPTVVPEIHQELATPVEDIEVQKSSFHETISSVASQTIDAVTVPSAIQVEELDSSLVGSDPLPESQILSESDLLPERNPLPKEDLAPEGDILPQSDLSLENDPLPKKDLAQEGNFIPESDLLPAAELLPETDLLKEADLLIAESVSIQDIDEQPGLASLTTPSGKDQMRPTTAMTLVAETCAKVPMIQTMFE